MAHSVLARSCALKSWTFAAAAPAQRVEGLGPDPAHLGHGPKHVGDLLRFEATAAMAHSVLARSCALKSWTFAAAAPHSESKTSGRTLLVAAMAHSVFLGVSGFRHLFFELF